MYYGMGLAWNDNAVHTHVHMYPFMMLKQGIFGVSSDYSICFHSN